MNLPGEQTDSDLENRLTVTQVAGVGTGGMYTRCYGMTGQWGPLPTVL